MYVVRSLSMQPRVHSRDGVFAWIVCICAVLSNILIFGCTQSFGLIYPVLLDEFHEGKAKTAWVGSLALALPMTLSPLAARLIIRYGARPMSMAGAVIAALGLFLTSFVNSITLMYITFSLIYGFGTSLPYTACYDIVPKYFKKRLALATGAMVSGTGATVFIMSPINETLVTHVGWRKAFYAFAGFSLMAGICCLSFSPDVEKDVTPQSRGRTVLLQRRVQSTPLYRNGRYLICCAYSFIFQLGNTIPLIHLGRYALDSGLNSSQTANLYIGYGISSMVGRILSGRVCDMKFINPSYLCCLTAFIAGSSTIVCPFINGFLALIIYFCINGLMDGFHVTSKSFTIMQFCSEQQRTSAFGYFFFVTSFAYCSGAPLGGLIADQVGSYVPVFYASGSIVVFSGVVMMTVQCFKPKYYEETTRTELNLLSEEDVIVEKVTVL